ncbi:DUF5047 domain-containing protein [Streptomyces sp. NPDC091212]|uniref:DUF5047 domain-containing protein n=1 Tax=Streptomyces sp. NPDC091212 TaxID=3155191 RepID=UPI003422F558
MAHDVSSAFRQALTTSHRIVTRVDAHYAGQVVAEDIPIQDGTVTLDRGSKVRRSLSLTISDVKYLPWNATDPLAVYGQTLVVSRGIVMGTNPPEMIRCGTFRIDEPSGDTHFGPVTLTGKSSEVAIQDDRFMVPMTTRGYTNCVEAISYLIRLTLPSAVITNQTAGLRNPTCAIATWDAQTDRWDAVTQIATAMNAEIYVDSLDRFVIRDLPTVSSEAVAWDIADGEGGTLMSSARTMSRTSVYNAVVATGESISTYTAPVSAVAYDNSPSSPTRWGGPYGKVPRFYTSALLLTTGSCQVAADGMLFDAIAPNIQAQIQASPNPAMEPGDCLRIVYGDRRELSIAQTVSIPLTAEGTSTLTLRGGKEETT